MTCPTCGLALTPGLELCPYHAYAVADNWAAANRIVCDLIHRGKTPKRLTEVERSDDFYGTGGEA